MFLDKKARLKMRPKCLTDGKVSRKEGRGLLDGVPGSLPALLMALRISDKARNVGFDWPDNQGAVDKLDEEIAELKSHSRRR